MSAIVVDAHEGRVIDSPVSGAVVFIDLNGDKELTDGETEGATDEEGYFSVARGDNDTGAMLVSVGGTDTRLVMPYLAVSQATFLKTRPHHR